MTQLRRLQAAFQRHIDWPGGGMEREVLSTPRAAALRRLSVYASAYRSRFVEALGKDYEGLRALLGERGFEKLVLAFIAARPSHHANLRWYGAELAAFLARSPRYRERPILRELAAFEWALGLAFDVADAPVMTADEIAGLPVERWPGMRLRLHPSVQRLALRTNAPVIWSAMRDHRPLPRAALKRSSVPWVAWRQGLTPHYRSLDRDEAWALGALARGTDFASLCEGLSRHVGLERAPARAAKLLKGWIRDGLICSPAAGEGRE